MGARRFVTALAIAALSTWAAIGQEPPEQTPSAWMVTAADRAANPCSWNSAKTPWRTPPSSLWTGLEPIGPLPLSRLANGQSRDTTWSTTAEGYSLANPFWTDIAVDGNLLHAALGIGGLQTWSLGTSTRPTLDKPVRAYSGKPRLPAQEDGGAGGGGGHDFRTFLSVAAGGGYVALSASTGGVGFLLLDAANRAVLYQDGGPDDNSKGARTGAVAITSVNGRAYGILAAETNVANNTSGVWIYDLDLARERAPCWERQPALARCSGVVVGHLGGSARTVAASGRWVAVGGTAGVVVYDLVTGAVGASVQGPTDGVALWVSGAKTYLAAVATPGAAGSRLSTWDASCLPVAGCQPRILYSQALSGMTPGRRVTLKFSPPAYLYIGHEGWGPPAALLLDATNPSGPKPVATAAYWSHYDPCVATGSNNYEPLAAVVTRGRVYRANYSSLDVHRLRGATEPLPPAEPVPPTIPPEKPPEEPKPDPVPPTKPPTLTFSVSPPSPIAGREATFVSSVRPATATGLPAWVFRGIGSALGTTVRQVFPAAGEYQVYVSAVPVGCASPHCVLGASAVVTVVAGSEPPPPVDSDKDGVVDEFDDCPREAGPPPRGCPVAPPPSDDPTTCTPPRVLTAPGRVVYRPGEASTGRLELELSGPWVCADGAVAP